MNPDRDDEKLESYLRQFHARAPRPLAVREPRAVFPRMAAIAAAIAVIVISGILLFHGGRQPNRESVETVRQAEPIAEEISLVRLSRFAQQEPDKLDRHLTELSAKTLPDVRSGEGVLKRLARE